MVVNIKIIICFHNKVNTSEMLPSNFKLMSLLNLSEFRTAENVGKEG